MTDTIPVPCAICGAEAKQIETPFGVATLCSRERVDHTGFCSGDAEKSVIGWNKVQAETAAYIAARAAANGPVIEKDENGYYIMYRGYIVFACVDAGGHEAWDCQPPLPTGEFVSMTEVFDAIDAHFDGKGEAK